MSSSSQLSRRPTAVRGEPILDRRLPNGARVIVVGGERAAPVIAAQLWVAAGTAAERSHEHGSAHLLEHMTFKPHSTGAGETDLAVAIEQLGGDVNAFTSHDETVYHVTAPAAVAERAVTVLLDAVLGVRLDVDELARERQVVLEEIKQYADDPGSEAMQDLVGLLFRGDAYARPVLGLASEIRTREAATLRRFHREVYAGDKLCLVVAGPVDPKRVWALARRRLGRVPRRSRRVALGGPALPSRPQVKVRREAVVESTVRLGWAGPAIGHPDAVALDVLAIALGQGDASRLTRRTRRGQQLVTEVNAGFLAFARAGTLIVSAQTTTRKLVAAAHAMLGEIEQLRWTQLDLEELARARAVLESGLVYRRETVQGQAHAVGHFATLAGGLEAEQAYYAALARIGPEEIRAAAERYLGPRACAIVVLVPKAEVGVAQARAIASELRGALAPRRRRARARSRTGAGGVWSADLDGGLRIRVLPRSEVPIAAGWLIWPGGLRLEPARHAGVAHLAASLLVRGTREREGDTLAREIDGMAAMLDGFSGRNSIGLQFESLTQHVPNVLARALECAIHPVFPERELNEERRVALEELEAEADDVGQVAYQTMLEMLYGTHPYHRNTRGTVQSLARTSRAVVAGTWRRHYPIGRAVLALAGDVEVEALIDRVSASIEQLAPRRAEVSRVPAWPGGAPRWPARARRRRIPRERAQGHIVIGFPGVCLGDPRTAALEVMLTVLGGQSGRLFHALREKQGLVYHVGATSTEGIDGGHITIYAATSHQKRESAIAAIDVELARIRDVEVGEGELTRAKSWLCGQHETGNQRRARLASHLAFGEVYQLGVAHFLEYPARVRRVSAAAVRRVARELLDPARRAVVVSVEPD